MKPRFVLTLIGLLLFSAIASANDSVKLALNWVPEPEFGGIYAADQNGDFKKHGLDVTIQPGGAGTPTWQLVSTGKVDYAVASADEVVLANAQGADIVAIFATYQTCPQGIMVHASRGLNSLEDLFKHGGKLAVEPGLAYVDFLKKKYDLGKMQLVSYDGGLGSFLNDKNFSQQCFITSEPIAAKNQGGDPQVFLVADSGYNPYTAVIITRRQRVQQSAKQVDAMVQSLRDGWRRYLKDPQPTNEAMSKLNPDMTSATMSAAADAQKPLIELKAGEPGSMTESRWKELIDQMIDLKLVAPDKSPKAADCFVK